MIPPTTHRNHPLLRRNPLHQNRHIRNLRRRQSQHARLPLSHAINPPLLVQRQRVILPARHIDNLGVQQRAFQFGLVGVIHPPREERSVVRDGGRVGVSRGDLYHRATLEQPLDGTGKGFHRVHVRGQSHAGTQLPFIVPSPRVDDARGVQRQPERVTARDGGHVLGPQELDRLEVELVDRLEVPEPAVRSGAAGEDLSLGGEDGGGVFSAVDVGGEASVLDEGGDDGGRGVGVHVAVAEASHAVDAGSAVAEGVEIAGGGEEGGEVGSEGGFGDGVREGKVDGLAGLFFVGSDSQLPILIRSHDKTPSIARDHGRSGGTAIHPRQRNSIILLLLLLSEQKLAKVF
mmetsp:Transcript_20487/g.42971  ORF Transcript_20487/g.42971 Transcript_20487/m.42971 type:complete len:346 (+) Transcript_20487:244-1281(+)